MNQKLRVLIVDDSKSVHAFVKGCLAAIQAAPCGVFDGEEAMATLKAGPADFDLVLLDWEMPKKTGPETLRELRQLGLSVPVIMMTTKNAVEDIQGMIEAGANEYMMKPFTRDILLEKIEAVLGRSVRDAA